MKLNQRKCFTYMVNLLYINNTGEEKIKTYVTDRRVNSQIKVIFNCEIHNQK